MEMFAFGMKVDEQRFEDAPHSSLKASPYQRWNWRAGAIFERFANPTIIKGWERQVSRVRKDFDCWDGVGSYSKHSTTNQNLRVG
jgi:hypothetical protein